MDTKVFCVYNVARGVFLSSKVTVADGANQPLTILKVLVGGLAMDSKSGLWLSPVYGMPAVPRLFPFDLLYLDSELGVLDLAEFVPGAEFPPYRSEVASALVLPSQSLHSTQTERGDRLLICLAEEMESRIAVLGARSSVSVATPPKKRGGIADPQVEPARSAALGSRIASPAGGEAVAVAEEVLAPALEKTAKELSASEAKSEPHSRSPVMSITEVILERPRTLEPPVVVGLHGDVEDLFSNWMDTPTLASTWKAGVGEPLRQQIKPPLAPTDVADTEPIRAAASASTTGHAPSIVSKADLVELSEAEKIKPSVIDPSINQTEIRPQTDSGGAVKTQNSAVSSKAELELSKSGSSSFGSSSVVTSPVSTPIRVALPRPAQATTSTVAQYGLWRASLPTAVIPVAAVKGSADGLSEGTAAQCNFKGRGEEITRHEGRGPETDRFRCSDSKTERCPLRRRQHLKPRRKDGYRLPVSEQRIARSAATTRAPATEAVDIVQRKLGIGHSKVPKVPAAAGFEKAEAVPVKNAAASGSIEPAGDVDATEFVVGIEPAAAAQTGVSESVVRAEEVGQNGTLKPPIKVVEAKRKAPAAVPTLAARFKRWLNPSVPKASDRRRAYRRHVPGMVAHYYTGGPPTPHEIADISMTGLYLLTEDRWMPDTMIRMTLQKPCAKGGTEAVHHGYVEDCTARIRRCGCAVCHGRKPGST